MACYETHFGQKITGALGSREDNKARKKVCAARGTGEKAALASGLGSTLDLNPPTLVASVFVIYKSTTK